ncbi:MAG: TlyA family RNA methyltransferase [Rickettsiaceae bacterium]|nr:TlyA family RNA methyltransferase [Rickettsiaceae bacterium]
MASNKKRLDTSLVERGLVPDVNTARSLIMQGLVHNENSQLLKAGMPVKESDQLFVKSRKDHNYVSRGALKLKKAIEEFDIDVTNRICLDIGCSTGGFTEILLENGASLVYAVDVAYGEIHPKFRNNEKVVLLERLNARHLTRDHIKTAPDIIVCDASFITLKSVLPASLNLAAPNFTLIALIKPQFEAQKQDVGEKGIISDPSIHKKVCAEVKSWLESEMFDVENIIESPILGMKGNKEFLICARKYARN